MILGEEQGAFSKQRLIILGNVLKTIYSTIVTIVFTKIKQTKKTSRWVCLLIRNLFVLFVFKIDCL